MVLIELDEESNGENNYKSQPKSIATGYDSDGYETASETELNDGVCESENRSDIACSADNPITNRMNENAGSEAGHDAEEDERLLESESNEKALAQANDEKLEGNSLFQAGLYEEALLKYELATQISPYGPSSTELRSICHANRAACFSKLGKFEETIKECTKALELNPTYIKALLRRGEALEKLEQYEESIADMTKILELDQSNDQARQAIIRLKPLAEEKREKMNEEMIVGVGKLKEMGNYFLGRFGMSVDNFKAVKDPNTGSYSISFQQ